MVIPACVRFRRPLVETRQRDKVKGKLPLAVKAENVGGKSGVRSGVKGRYQSL
jgi:hypothetical protein